MATVSITLCAAILFASSQPVSAEESSASYREYLSGGTAGTGIVDESRYTVVSVSTEEELAQLAENCGLDIWSGDKYVTLENDIELQEHRNLMIPSFNGIFEGNGHKISNLQIDDPGSAVGLFRYIQADGIVRNLEVTGRVQPQGSQDRAGILAGVNYGSILNCSVYGSVSGDREIGGIVGLNAETGEIRRSQSSAMVTGNHSAGGICGSNRGILNNCKNMGNINIHSTEVSYDLEDLTMENLEDINSTDNTQVHTDTGGIAGYSEGKIYYCSNSGTVGYQHIGYNTGGIVGRLHQGYLQNCSNTGHVMGRKDVGGIAGQMEPFLEIQYLNDKLGEIDRETEKFFDLLEVTHEDLSSYGSEGSALIKDVTDNLRNINSAMEYLTAAGNDLIYIYNQELTGINDDLKRLNTELGDLAESDKENGNTTDHIVVDGSILGSVSGGDITIRLPNDKESYLAALRRFGESAGGHVSNMTGAVNDRSGGVTDNLEIVNREAEAAGNSLSRLASVLEEGTDKNAENVDALIAQAKVLRRSVKELRDDLFRYEGITTEDTSDEAASDGLENPGVPQEEAYYDTSAFQQGKITLCVNQGLVEADTNVGGIVGQVATEYDFDPEEDITVTGAESFHIEQAVKAVIRESRNLGTVIGKKNYVGGVVGKADFGAVISCESYGDVSSTNGNYVGGIAGSSSYCVRSCYSMGNLSGKSYVGGIAGTGCDIFYSYSYPVLEYTGECAGSIAGQLNEDGVLCGNYYVEGNVPGIDSIGYQGGAAPLAYGEFCNMPGVPETFSQFTVRFLAEGQELAVYQCSYGDKLDPALIPRIPEKEGYYGCWPEFDASCITGNLTLEAQYEKWISTLASAWQEDGKAKVLVQGEFLPGNVLETEEVPEGIRLSIVYRPEETTAAVGALTGNDTATEGDLTGNDTATVGALTGNDTATEGDLTGNDTAAEGDLTGNDTAAGGVLTGNGTTAGGSDGQDFVTVRVLCEEPEKAKVELYREGTYIQTPAEVVGSYVEFDMEQPGIFRLTEEQDTGKLKTAAIGAAAVLAVLLLIVIAKKIGSRRSENRKTEGKTTEDRG